MFFFRIAVLIVMIISTRVVFLRKRRHNLQFSAKTWNKEINGGRHMLGNKDLKHVSSSFGNRLKFSKIYGKDLLCTKI